MSGVPKVFALDSFIARLRSESDLACAILAGTYIESTLEEFMAAHLAADAPARVFSRRGGLVGTFNAKIEVAFAIGWLSKDEKLDLHAIREIRNDFAHAIDHDLNFSSPIVLKRCLELVSPRILLNELGELFTPLGDDPRWRFEMAVGFLRQALTYRGSIVSRPVRPASSHAT